MRGPFITGSYHGEAPAADKFTADGWLRTGDVAAIDQHGYLRIADRTKDLIKSGGEWISSVDLENAIMAHPAVAEAAVIAVAHPKWGERPLACVVHEAGGGGGGRGIARAAGAEVRALAVARRLRIHRRGAAHLDRQVLEVQAARTLRRLAMAGR